MRLQLKALALAAAVGALSPPPAARANNTQAAQRVTLFREPSSENKGVLVIHPQTDASAALGSAFSLAAGYSVDIVSGASPAVFGPRNGVDAVSGATNFSDTRQQVRGGFSYDRPAASLAASYSYGWESDYRSHSVSASTHTDSVDHNYTLALAYTHNFDSVCDANNQGVAADSLNLRPLTSSAHCFDSTQTDVTSHRLHIDSFEPSLTWTMTPRLVVQAGGTAQILDGFQSNPYRSVLLGGQHRTPQEHLPEFRQRYAVFGRLAYAFPNARASGLLMARVYRDSWAVQSLSGEAVLNKYLGQAFLFSLVNRYHIQQAASFYRGGNDYRNLGPVGSFWTGDRELSPMSNYLLGGKMALLRRPEQERSSWFVEMELDVKVELLLYFVAPDAPNADRKFANIWQAAFSLRF